VFISINILNCLTPATLTSRVANKSKLVFSRVDYNRRSNSVSDADLMPLSYFFFVSSYNYYFVLFTLIDHNCWDYYQPITPIEKKSVKRHLIIVPTYLYLLIDRYLHVLILVLDLHIVYIIFFLDNRYNTWNKTVNYTYNYYLYYLHLFI
jgi:hypothetical protein